MSDVSDNDIERMIGRLIVAVEGKTADSIITMLRSLRDERRGLKADHDALAQDAARWRLVRRYMRLDDVGDQEFCLGLVIDSDALEHAVTMQSARLYAERAVAAWEDVRGPEDSPKDLPRVTLEDAIDAAMAEREGEA